MAASSSCWADLPPEILLSIARWLNLADVIRLRAICFYWALAFGKKSGRSVQPSPRPRALILQPSPWLLLPIAPKENANFCNFFSLFENRFYQIASLPQITIRRFVGSSSDGWLVIVDNHFTPRLLNPLTRKELSLPSLLTLRINSFPIFDPTKNLASLYNIKKIILTQSPLQRGIAVAFCYLSVSQNFLSFATIEDEEWSPLLAPKQSSEVFEDVTYHEKDGKLYALTNQGAVYIIKCTKNRSWEMVSMVAGCIDNRPLTGRRRYIIFSRGDLLQVSRDTIAENPTCSNYFRVFKFNRNCHDHHEQQLLPSYEAGTEPDPRLCPYASCWLPIEDLGDRSLFVGSNNSFSLHCVDELYMMRNKVYFTGDMVSKWLQKNISEAGMFNLKSKKTDYIFPFDYGNDWPPPFWFMPGNAIVPPVTFESPSELNYNLDNSVFVFSDHQRSM